MINLNKQKQELQEELILFIKGEDGREVSFPPMSNIILDEDFIKNKDMNLRKMQKYLIEEHGFIVDHVVTTSNDDKEIIMLEIFNDDKKQATKIASMQDGVWIVMIHENANDAVHYVDCVIEYLKQLEDEDYQFKVNEKVDDEIIEKLNQQIKYLKQRCNILEKEKNLYFDMVKDFFDNEDN